MEKYKIGSLEVFAIGLGFMGLTHGGGVPMIVAEGAKVLQQAFDLGYGRFI